MMTWDFFRQFNSFADLSIGNFDTNAFSLYIRLLMINNKAGRIEWFGVTNERLIVETGLNEKSIIKARNDLIQKGFINYAKGKKGSPSRYSIVPLDENFLKYCNKFTEYYTPKNIQGIFYSEYDSKYDSVSDSENGSVFCSESDSVSCSHNRVEKISVKQSRVNGDTHARTHAQGLVDENLAKVVAHFETTARPLSTHEVEQLDDLITEYTVDTVTAAIDIAVADCKRKGDRIQSMKYIDAICQRLHSKEVTNNANSSKRSDTDLEEDEFFNRPIRFFGAKRADNHQTRPA